MIYPYLTRFTEIIRPQALRKRMEDQAASTKRFHREIGALIARVSSVNLFWSDSQNNDWARLKDYQKKLVVGSP